MEKGSHSSVGENIPAEGQERTTLDEIILWSMTSDSIPLLDVVTSTLPRSYEKERIGQPYSRSIYRVNLS